MPKYNDPSLFYNSTVPYVGTGGSSDIATARTESEVLQPNFIRRRFAYRSPMSSLKMNQDASAFKYDMVKLYQKFSLLESTMTNSVTTLTSQKIQDFPSGVGISWGNIDDSISLAEMSTLLDKLNKRIEKLERRV